MVFHGYKYAVKGLIPAKEAFVTTMQQDLVVQKVHTKRSVEHLAATFTITDKTEVKELTELAIVRCARMIAQSTRAIKDKYDQIVVLYKSQVNLSHRTSMSMLLQQYSTPAPIGYLMGLFAGLDSLDKGNFGFEPSAGNGMLTIAGDPRFITVNEIDDVRRRNLETQGYRQVWNKDASEPFIGHEGQFQAVVSNPPFGTLRSPVPFGTYRINTLDGVMALRALETLTPDGRAAIIIGGHTRWDLKGRVQAGRNRIFFNYLYNRYHIADVININGRSLFSRQGTSFNTRIILVAGRKMVPAGVAPLYDAQHDKTVHTFDALYDRCMAALNTTLSLQVSNPQNEYTMNDLQRCEREAQAYLQLLEDEGLGAPYQPASHACMVLDTQVPDSMAFETQAAIQLIARQVGGDIDNFVRDRLAYRTKADMCRALSAEQIDAVAMGIYNIEARGQGMIIGDQTGIGKGRVAAGMIRYACAKGLKPVFITEKTNLFSDIYRDLVAIGSGHLRPFIVNARESKSNIKDEAGEIVYEAQPPAQQQTIFTEGIVPAEFDFVCATYSQFNSAEKKPLKPSFLQKIAAENIFIMDEAHNASGSSQTGTFLREVVRAAAGVVFLSATFAKRPDNMPIFAMKTAISDSNMSNESLIHAITKGGVALQEVLSAQLVQEGQMLRRERSYEGVEVNYITLTEQEAEHKAIADNITQVMRDIIAFQKVYIDPEIADLDSTVAASGREATQREGTSEAGVANEPYFSKIFQVINQMLFSLKAEAVADRAIMRLREGKKPVIAFSSTMGSFVENLVADSGAQVTEGIKINADFREVLFKGLEGVLRYTIKGVDGTPVYASFDIKELSLLAQIEYKRIESLIKAVSTGISISPIDVVIKRLRAAGYNVAEVTGRKWELLLDEKNTTGIARPRKKINTNDAFRLFNDNVADVLLINQSGSTGASAHAIPTSRVPASEVKQRAMIVLQAELDINTEVQKRGRINRTGQLFKPIYDYISSTIPAELRMMMILQRKLKSLDANTTSNQKQSASILDVPDFLNKYGDKVVTGFLTEHPEIDALLDFPLQSKTELRNGNGEVTDGALKVSGRVAVLSTQMQQQFYEEVSGMYNEYVVYLKQKGDYDLEVETMALAAATEATSIIKVGKGTNSVFGTDSILEKVTANVLRKPFSPTELNNVLQESLNGRNAEEIRQEMLGEFRKYGDLLVAEEIEDINASIDKLQAGIQEEKKIKNLAEHVEEWRQAVIDRQAELEELRRQKTAQVHRKAQNSKHTLNTILQFFHIGQSLYYPYRVGINETLVPAVFLGYLMDWTKKNPFAPSNVKLRFALSDSHKYLVLPASNTAEIMSIIGASKRVEEMDRFALLDAWEAWVKESSIDRQTRYIITGNLLQAFADHPGKLISYTTIDDETKKGILMPEYWNPKEQLEDKVSVPVFKAKPIILSLTRGNSLKTNTDIVFFRSGEQEFKIIASAARSANGDIFLNEELLKLVKNGNFEKTSNKMVAYVPLGNMPAFIELVQRIDNSSVLIPSAQLKYVKSEAVLADRRPIRRPEPEPASPVDDEELELAEAEAQAVLVTIELELELLRLRGGAR
jgi:hypothetical protein